MSVEPIPPRHHWPGPASERAGRERTLLSRFAPHLLGLLWFALLAPGLGGCAAGPLDKVSSSLFTAGYDSFRAAKFADAERQFTQVISRNPGNASLSEVYYFRGLSRLKLGRREQAKSDFRQGATSYGRELTQIYSAVALANLEFEESHDKAAADLYKQALDHPVKDLPLDAILFRLGVSSQRLGRWQQADDAFARLVSKYPESPLAPEARRRFQASYFTVQAGAFAERKNAEALVDRLKQKGFPASPTVVASQGKTLHLVNVGRYRTYREAESVAAQLKGQGISVLIRP